MVIRRNYDINLHLRNNILKTQSLIYNQFSSPRFVNMFMYAWWKSGYITENQKKFQLQLNTVLTMLMITVKYVMLLQ